MYCVKVYFHIPIHYGYKEFRDVPKGYISDPCGHKIFVFTFDLLFGKVESKASCSY